MFMASRFASIAGATVVGSEFKGTPMNNDGQIIILHLSDLHRTPRERLTNRDLLIPLMHDIQTVYAVTNRSLRRDEPQLPGPREFDLVVVSGDLTQCAKLSEYLEAESLLETIVNELLDGDRSRLVVTCGNHDVDWGVCRAAYREVTSPSPDQIRAAQSPASNFRLEERNGPLHHALMERVRNDLYQKRLGGFAEFIKRFYGEMLAFPLEDPTRQYLIFDRFAKSLGIILVSFNSCDQSDHLWRHGSIHRECILNASKELNDRYGSRRGPLRIAVWHHNVLGSPMQPDFLDPAVPLMLAGYGFVLGLHGHIHEAGRLELLGSDARIPVVWAGSLAAGATARSPSIPLLYNVIGIDVTRSDTWVHVRARKNQQDVWSAFHDWSPEHRCWYRVELPPPPGAVERARHRVYPNIYDTGLLEELDSLLLHAKRLIVIAPAGLIVQGNFRHSILRRAQAGELRATLCYGNPYSKYVRHRLEEEERCSSMPDIGREGIIKRIRSILKAARSIKNKKVKVRLFNNYPTMAIIRLDDRYVYYPLGYRTLGSLCPAVVEEESSLFGQFLRSEVARYLKDSFPAARVFREI